MRRIFMLTLIVLLIAIAAATDALACRCFLPELTKDDDRFREIVAARIEASDVVFSGKVIGQNQTRIEFRVERVWRGAIDDAISLRTGGSDTEPVATLPTSCDYNFKTDQSYLVFADGEDADRLKATSCNLTQPLDTAGRTLKVLDSLPRQKISLTLLHFESDFLDNYSFYEPDIHQRTEKSHRRRSHAQGLAL